MGFDESNVYQIVSERLNLSTVLPTTYLSMTNIYILYTMQILHHSISSFYESNFKKGIINAVRKM